MKLSTVPVLAAAWTMAAAAAASAGPDPTGTWVMENGKVTVRIGQCGMELCGTIVGLAKPLDKKGKPKRDKKNPDRSLRDRPIIGLRILRNMQSRGDGKWEGAIYNADDGNTYRSTMRLHGDEMRVKGCVTFICKAMDFKRAD